MHETISKFVNANIHWLNFVQASHWQTKSYAEHEALGEHYTKFNELNDRFVETYQGDDARIAEEAGADYISDDELVKKIEDGWAEFDVAIATPDQMPKIGKLGRYLGRKGLMPNPRTGTVVQPENISSAIDSAKKGRAEIKLDKGANIHVRIGTVKFESNQLLDNLSSVYSTIIRNRPDSIKGSLVKNVSMCTTMGPSIRLSQTELEKLASGSK